MTTFADEHYTASVLLGVVAPDYLPADERLRMFVAAVRVAGVGADNVMPVLFELDPEWAWGTHYAYLLDSWGDRVDRARALAPVMLFVELATEAIAELRRAEREVANAREVAEAAKDTLNMLAEWVAA